MGIFKKKRAQVVRRGVGDQAIEERTVRKVGSSTVEVRRVRQASVTTKPKKAEIRSGRASSRSSKSTKHGRRDRSQRPEPEVILPPETDRKQMLVRRTPHQTQLVVLEGAVLVEHYVALEDRLSLAHNIYIGRVRNVLPGMEAAFIDFGESKNGVLYAGDIAVDPGSKRHPRIEKALKVGDEVLVQVVKDAMGHKGARLTNQISLPGRYLVLAPASDMRGISRRLPEDERERLRKIIAGIRPDDFGVIVRTAAQGASEEDLRRDIDRLTKVWEAIQEELPKGRAPRLLHEEPPLVIRVIREHFTRDFRRLMVDDPDIYERVTDYLESTDPTLVSRVKMYKKSDLSLFERFHVEDQLRKALDRKVWLPSGGHIVIDRTEALTVVDVNTGKFVGHSNLEETVLQNNLEAAEEIAHQLRLRDIGGIIVIDFIDMEIARNREAVLQRMREQLAKDKTRTQVFDVSNLGLVEMTRKNVSEGLVESFSHACPTCAGRGVVLHEEAATEGAAIPDLEPEAAS